jgi:2',3'-cyclic-nucleotide 2'-phosphodiesterase (5'-nucleotidase family)
MFIVIIVICALVLGVAYSQQKNQKQEIVFLYTNSLNGILEACQCSADPKGGLVKRGHAIAELKKKYPDALLFESGDFCSYYPDTLLTKYLIKGYKHIGYTAVGIGDQEFAAGIDTFYQYQNELPFVCANLQYFSDGKWQFPKKHVTVTIGNYTIAITALIDNDAFKYYPNEIVSKIKISNPKEALQKEIKNLTGKFIVVISHLGFEKDKELAVLFPQIGLIIGGHSQTLVKKPVKVGNTLIVQAGPNGSRIGILRAIVTDTKITSYEHSFVLPKWEDPDDPVIEKLITQYNAENAKRFPR